MNKKSCLYARVSTTQNDQDTSYENQKKIQVEGYDIIHTYADRGTGTQVKNRKYFKEMINDCGVDIQRVEDTNIYNFIPRDREPKYEAIIVTHTSRFIRNQLMMKSCINALRQKNVEIYFTDLGKSSLDKDIDFIMNILFLLDEQESLNISKKVRNGMQRSRDNKKYIQVSKMFGYDYIQEKNKLVINPEEAEVVRKIFSMYLDGNGYRKIFDYINENYPQYDKKISQIACILKNEKYAGYNAYGKWSVNKMEGIKKKNREYEIFPTDRIEPIITFEEWSKVQDIINSKKNGSKGVKHKQYPLSQKIKCSVCGNTFIRGTETKGKYSRVFWQCKEKKMYGLKKCDNVNISEKELIKQIMSDECGIRASIKSIEFQLEILLKQMENIDTSKIEERLTEIKEEFSNILRLQIKGKIKEEDYDNVFDELSKEENVLKKELKSANDINSAVEEVKNLSYIYRKKLEKYLELMMCGKYDEVFNNIEYIIIGRKTILDKNGFVKRIVPIIEKIRFKDFQAIDVLFEESKFKVIKNF